MRHTLTEAMAARLAEIALGHVTREYPNKLDHVLAGPADAATPAALHPVFHGSLDWHSCVHGYWMLAHLLRRFPDFGPAEAIVALFDAQLVAEKVAVECAYLARPSARGFERPYGWAWLLKLASALGTLPDRRWADALAPLRLRPSADAELATQALKGERVTIYDRNDEGWAWGQLEMDGYVGWLPDAALARPAAAPST